MRRRVRRERDRQLRAPTEASQAVGASHRTISEWNEPTCSLTPTEASPAAEAPHRTTIKGKEPTCSLTPMEAPSAAGASHRTIIEGKCLCVSESERKSNEFGRPRLDLRRIERRLVCSGAFSSPLGYSDPGFGLAGTWKSTGHVEITSARQPPAGGVDFRHAGTKQW